MQHAFDTNVPVSTILYTLTYGGPVLDCEMSVVCPQLSSHCSTKKAGDLLSKKQQIKQRKKKFTSNLTPTIKYTLTLINNLNLSCNSRADCKKCTTPKFRILRNSCYQLVVPTKTSVFGDIHVWSCCFSVFLYICSKLVSIAHKEQKTANKTGSKGQF